MTLKRTVETLDGLDDAHKALYVEKDGKFVLDVEPDNDADALKRAKDRETQAAKDLRVKLAEEAARREALEAELAEATGQKKKPDELQKAYEKKLGENEAKWKLEVEKREAFIKKSMIDAQALKLASELFTSPALGERFIRDRLAVDMEGDEPVLRVLDSAGQVSASSLADLKKEFLDNKEYAPILVGSKATGSGAAGSGKGGGSAAPQPHEMSGAERAAWAKSDPAGFMAAKQRGAFNPPAKT